MKKQKWILLSLSACVILLAVIGPAMAYFTAHTQALGGYPIHIGGTETFEERVSSWTKHLTVSSQSDSEPVYVRARGFCGAGLTLAYESDGSWFDGEDGFWYYSPILYGGQTTQELRIGISNIPEDPEEGQNFNVVVVYETTPVLYNTQGEPYADWTLKMDWGED